MAAHAYSCYRIRDNAERRLARFQGEFPTGDAELVELDELEGLIYSDGVL